MPRKTPSHNLFLSTDSKKPNKDGFNYIFIIYKYMNIKKGKRTDFKIKLKHWDKSKRFIHKDYEEKYPNEMITELYNIISQFNVLRAALREKTISYQGAFDKLLKKGSEAVNLIEFVKASKDLTPKDRKKYEARFSALENKHLPKKYIPLTTDILEDEYRVKDIAQILKEKTNLDNNTIRETMYNLDRCGRLAGNANYDLFKRLKLKPDSNPPDPSGVEYRSLMEGINKVKTLQDLEAYLFWLYSFCLLGLDANDIINIDESMVWSGKTKEHYYPDAKFDTDNTKMSNKMHIRFRRKKNSVPIVMLANLFPTLFIRDWLHYLIKINRPSCSYKGSDRFRLFNFKTLTKTGAADMEGEAKKKAITDTYRKKTQNMFGGTLQQTRHTVTGQGAELGMNQRDLDIQLGHKVSGTLKHYLKVQQIPKDVNHTHIIQEFGIIKILNILIEKLEGATEIVDSKEHEFLTPEWDKYFGIGLFMAGGLKYGILTSWSRQDEIRYQQLMSKATKGNYEIIGGTVVNSAAHAVDYPDELKKLIDKRQKLVPKQRMDRFKIGKAKMERDFREKGKSAKLHIEIDRKIKKVNGEWIVTEKSNKPEGGYETSTRKLTPDEVEVLELRQKKLTEAPADS